ncbi:MAG: MarR family winged helix-turn-helix transcriptional regulator [Sphingomonas sp.]|uniref:MarR family winged helix-turn-helix transcriptional regulator n=1 Tax=Sphingomonas sp. TaxID=28214 RepID=UPI003F7F548C
MTVRPPLEPDAAADPLGEDLLRAIGPLMRRLRTESNAGGLSWSQRVVMGRLTREGAATTADLARAENVKPQSMGATLAALEGEGLVARTPHPTDGRQFLYELTEKGSATRDEYRSLKRDRLAAALTALDEEEIAALRAALPVLRHLGEN